jgi:prepilin-type N-terminal cleavage/methylation domain-containing protein
MRNNKGFTLVEMAIVLVIIGIILGAVVKGQDLIVNAKAKQLATTVRQWQSLAYAYMDRTGRLPGDAGRDGIVGNTAATERLVTSTSIAEIEASMSQAPQNPVSIGGSSYWIYYGYDGNGAAINKNVIAVCKDVACNTAFTADELQIIQSIDTTIDGTSDAGLGQLRGATAITDNAVANTAQGRVQRVISAVTVANESAQGATNPWLGGTFLAAVWMFDKPY